MTKKKVYNYSLDPDVESSLHDAAQDLKRSKSSIVQEAIMKWLKKHGYNGH